MIDQATLDKIRSYKDVHPETTYDSLAALFRVSKSTVVKAMRSTGTGTTSTDSGTGLVNVIPGQVLNPCISAPYNTHLLLIAEPVIDRGSIVRFRYKKFNEMEWVELNGNTVAIVLDHVTAQGFSLVSIQRVHGSELRYSKPFQGEYELIFQRV